MASWHRGQRVKKKQFKIDFCGTYPLIFIFIFYLFFGLFPLLPCTAVSECLISAKPATQPTQVLPPCRPRPYTERGRGPAGPPLIPEFVGGEGGWLSCVHERGQQLAAIYEGGCERQAAIVPQQSLVELRVEGFCAIEECRRFQRPSWTE